MNFLGIYSSPIKNGNTAYLLDYALGEASKVEGIVTETGSTLINYLRTGGPTDYYGSDTSQSVKCAITCWDLTALQAKALYGHYSDVWVYTSL